MQIGNLEGYYHFQLNVSLYSEQDMDQQNVSHVDSRSIGSLSKMSRSPDLSEALKQHENVSECDFTPTKTKKHVT